MTNQHSKQGGQTVHNLKGCLCPEGSDIRFCLGKHQQESWKLRILDRLVKLGNFLHYKYGRNVVIPDEWSGDLYKDIGSIISAERQRVLDGVRELVDRYIENSASPLTMSSRGQDYINGYNRMAALEKQAFKNLKREIQTLKEMGDK